MAMRTGLRAVLIDLSGTLHIENTTVPGAAEALKRLRASPLRVKFVTNTTKESLSTLHRRLQMLGLDIAVRDIFSSLTAARNVVMEGTLRPMLLLQDDAKKDFEGISSDSPNSVVVGLSPDSFNYKTLNTAFRLVLDGSPLIAIHKAKYFKRLDGLALGPGPFVEALEYASGTKASVVGKPEKSFFLSALKSLECGPEEAVMIGDDARDDVQGAMKAGLKGILVKTGKYRHGDEHTIQPVATAVCKDFAEAVEYILTKMECEGEETIEPSDDKNEDLSPSLHLTENVLSYLVNRNGEVMVHRYLVLKLKFDVELRFKFGNCIVENCSLKGVE